VTIELPVIIEHAATRGQGQTLNIGFGGAFIMTPEHFAYGERVNLWLPLLGPGTVSCLSSVVRWCDDSGFGVQFLSLGAREAYALTELALADTLRRKPARALSRRPHDGMLR
jgi:Tfp pilus assembly protein PilZ